MTTTQGEGPKRNAGANHTSLSDVAAMGPIQGIAAEESAQQRGEDHSGVNEPKRALFGKLRLFGTRK